MATREELEQYWARTRQLLNEAVAFVPVNDYQMLKQYSDYLDHNELELAMDELVSVGEEKKYTAEFFKPLRTAAVIMGLTGRANEIESLIESIK